MPYNLGNLPKEEMDKVNVDLAASGVAYKERMNMPIVPVQVEAEQPEHLREYFRERLQHYREQSRKFPGPNDLRYQQMAEANGKNSCISTNKPASAGFLWEKFMPVSLTSQIGDKQQADQALVDAINAGMRVSVPGIIQSFDPGDETRAPTCVVLPSVKGYEPDSTGGGNSSSLPLLVDIPVIFPRGGGVTLTFPVKAGDECLLVFQTAVSIFGGRTAGFRNR